MLGYCQCRSGRFGSSSHEDNGARLRARWIDDFELIRSTEYVEDTVTVGASVRGFADTAQVAPSLIIG
jgi:hypothetical protein